MSADYRVTQAREFLDAISPYPVASRPHSVLMREDAELRRTLAQLLDVIGQAVMLTAGQRGVLGQALADGITWRESGDQCIGCDAAPAGRCDDHLADDERVAGYLQLARELGIEVSS